MRDCGSTWMPRMSERSIISPPWEQHPDLMLEAFQRQEAILRQAIGTHGGYAYKMVGDAFQAAFATASAALSAAVAAQRALASAILTEAPGVILLATSRERLGLRAEWISPLDGMVTEIDGVALFALTAQAVQPAFVLDDTTRLQVAAICARVGGMPLAIELAAG